MVFTKDLAAFGAWNVAADFDSGQRCGTGVLQHRSERWGRIRRSDGGGSFYVEEYKKPEYQVTVKPPVARVLQGSPIQANIEARYFFGEPVAGAKVKYVVHTSHALLVG